MSEPLTIQDLCNQTGLPRRTIHFYTQQGLLPPPEGAGLGARYGIAHLLRLQAIPNLRMKGMRLDQIREKFKRMSVSELSDFLADSQSTKEDAPLLPIAQPYLRYSFGKDIIISAPVKLPPAEQKKLDALLSEAQRIFNHSFVSPTKE